MSTFRNEVRSFSRIILIVSVIVSVLLVIWYARTGRSYRAIPEVRFDPARVLRVSDVSRVYRIVPDDRDPDVLWIGAREGLFAFNSVDLSWRRYGLDHGLPSETIAGLAVVRGVPCVATPKGLALRDPVSGLFRTLPAYAGKNVLAVERFRDDLYFSVESTGLFLFRPGAPEAVAASSQAADS